MVNLELPTSRYGVVEAVVWTVVAIGAVNWGLIGAMDTNLVAELVEPSTERLVYIAIGVLGAINLADLYTSASLLGGRS
jgi:uncharacterized membrane protein YuzA (DUF378 family)